MGLPTEIVMLGDGAANPFKIAAVAASWRDGDDLCGRLKDHARNPALNEFERHLQATARLSISPAYAIQEGHAMTLDLDAMTLETAQWVRTNHLLRERLSVVLTSPRACLRIMITMVESCSLVFRGKGLACASRVPAGRTEWQTITWID